MFPILIWIGNLFILEYHFEFGKANDANWNTKSEIGNIEVLDIILKLTKQRQIAK